MQRVRTYAWLCGLPVFAMCLTVYSAAALAAEDGPPVVTYESAGPVVTVGEQITVFWETADPRGPVRIDLIDAEAFQVVMVVGPDSPNRESDTPYEGSMDWTFPSDLACDHSYQFYIEDARPAWTYGPPFSVACAAPEGRPPDPGAAAPSGK
jgi:hypothetical protein